MRLIASFGTRPEFVKLAPIVAELRRRGHDVTTIATGQHVDPDLSDVFFRELDLEPDERWTLDADPSDRLGTILASAHRRFAAGDADALVLLGDTWTVPLFALAARAHRLPTIHLEAGLRSGNETSMEETNRKVAAVTAQLHLAPTGLAAENLLREGVDATRIHVVGNPVLDALRRLGVERVPVAERAGVVVTLHRATNVDDPTRLAGLLDLVAEIAHRHGPVTFPIHPRTADRAAAFGLADRLERPGVVVTRPLPYSAMVELLARSALVVTDSGGLQEEAAWFGVPTVVLRPTTPRWEGVDAGLAEVVGLDRERALAATARLAPLATRQALDAVPCPYGDGHTADHMADLLDDEKVRALLEIREPALGARGR